MSTRRFPLIAFASVGVLLPAGLRAQISAPGVSSPSPAVVRSVQVHPETERVAIEITASAPVVPQAQRLTGPDRLVFDFPGYQLQGANRSIPVHTGAVRQIRLSLFSVQPPVTRVVVDLSEPLEFHVSPEGSRVVIAIPLPAASLSQPSHRPGPATAIVASSSTPSAAPRNPAVVASSHTAANHSTAATAPESVTPAMTLSRVSAQSLQAKAKAMSVTDLQAVEDKAQTGDPEAETTLALAYHAALLLKRDDAESLRLLHKAADRNFMAAQEALGIFAEKGIGMAPAEAMDWFQKAAQQGSLDAATNIALLYADGVGVEKNQAQALTWFRKAADGGEAAAQYNLALMYARGEGVPKDYRESVRWLTAAADKNVVPAMLDLAAFDLHPPDGSQADVDSAIRYYQKADELGSERAPAILGNIYATGAAGKPDYEQAVKWYRKAADLGQREGQYGLGIRYAMGQGVPIDLTEARRLFTASADQGLPQAQYNLATMYEEGKGGPADAMLAARYYQMAADQGMAKAQFRLGRLLAGTRTAQTDRVSAYKWLMLAQASVKESSPVLNDLRKSMSAQEISEADHEVDSWRIAHPETRQ